jgi:hypothetical protein
MANYRATIQALKEIASFNPKRAKMGLIRGAKEIFSDPATRSRKESRGAVRFSNEGYEADSIASNMRGYAEGRIPNAKNSPVMRLLTTALTDFYENKKNKSWQLENDLRLSPRNKMHPNRPGPYYAVEPKRGSSDWVKMKMIDASLQPNYQKARLVRFMRDHPDSAKALILGSGVAGAGIAGSAIAGLSNRKKSTSSSASSGVKKNMGYTAVSRGIKNRTSKYGDY